jgi:hypothetical protein
VNTFRREPDGADRSSDQQQQVGAGLTRRRPDKAVETDTDRRHRPGACGVVGHTSDAVSGGNGGVGAENPVMSCDLDVLVEEAAEAVSS